MFDHLSATERAWRYREMAERAYRRAAVSEDTKMALRYVRLAARCWTLAMHAEHTAEAMRDLEAEDGLERTQLN
jgi:hypothetical protein